MPPSNEEIARFARDARHRRTVARRAWDDTTRARQLHIMAVEDMRMAGHRITQRVRESLWRELVRLEARAGYEKGPAG